MSPELLVLTPSRGSRVFCLYQGLQLVQLVVCQGVIGRGYSYHRWACRHSVLVVVHCDGGVKWGTQMLQLDFINNFVMRGTSLRLFWKAQYFQNVSSADTDESSCFIHTYIFEIPYSKSSFKKAVIALCLVSIFCRFHNHVPTFGHLYARATNLWFIIITYYNSLCFSTREKLTLRWRVCYDDKETCCSNNTRHLIRHDL